MAYSTVDPRGSVSSTITPFWAVEGDRSQIDTISSGYDGPGTIFSLYGAAGSYSSFTSATTSVGVYNEFSTDLSIPLDNAVPDQAQGGDVSQTLIQLSQLNSVTNELQRALTETNNRKQNSKLPLTKQAFCRKFKVW